MDARVPLMTTLLVVAGLAGLAPPAQAAGATVGLGIDDGGITEARAAGATPAFDTFWIGKWTASSGWGGLETMLKRTRSLGVTPVIFWYYWGNDGSPACIENGGCHAKSRAEWDSMTRAMAEKLRAHMGGATAYVVLENEFNKNGVTAASYAPTFDGHLEARAKTLKAVPGVKVVSGYGSWGEADWGRFPRLIAVSDVMGFQIMRASSRDPEASYRGAADKILAETKAARALAPGKPVMLYDLALSSFPDANWARIQAETMSAILSRRAEYAAAGLMGIQYRSVRDDPRMDTSDYFGQAETTWGLKTSTGTPKPAWDVWLRAASGGVVSSPVPPAGGYAATFRTSGGNEWWIQVGVSAAQAPTRVCASVNGGACQALAKQSWGDWAASFRVPGGSRVTFTATSSTGASATSGAYVWPTGEPALAAYSATFRNPSGNAWWVQVDVAAAQAPASVCARVDGAADCRPLTLRSWGAWAASFHVPTGARVTFEATAPGGGKAVSSAFAWPPGA